MLTSNSQIVLCTAMLGSLVGCGLEAPDETRTRDTTSNACDLTLRPGDDVNALVEQTPDYRTVCFEPGVYKQNIQKEEYDD